MLLSRERVRQEHLFDLSGEGVAAAVDSVELDRQAGDDPPDCRFGGIVTVWASSAAITASVTFAATRGERFFTIVVIRVLPAVRGVVGVGNRGGPGEVRGEVNVEPVHHAELLEQFVAGCVEPVTLRRRVRAVSAITNASRRSVFASPG